MTTRPLSPATESTASKLLPPVKRSQIEIWLDETIHYEPLQNCALEKRYGHASDPPMSPSSTLSTTPRSPGIVTSCPVCGRYFTGEEPPTPTEASFEPPAAFDPKVLKSRSVFRGLKAAMASLKVKDVDGHYDPALATKMFLAIPNKNNEKSNDSSSGADLGSSNDGDHGKKMLDERVARLQRAQKLLEKGRPKATG